MCTSTLQPPLKFHLFIFFYECGLVPPLYSLQKGETCMLHRTVKHHHIPKIDRKRTPMPSWCVIKAWWCMVRPHALMQHHALNRQMPLAAQATPKSWIRVNRASTLLCTGTVRLVCCTLRRRMLPRGPPRGPCSTDIFSEMTSGSQGSGLRVNCYRYRHIRTTSSMITRSQGLE